MSKCVKCGAELREDLNFCTKCGHKIEDEETIIKKKESIEKAKSTGRKAINYIISTIRYVIGIPVLLLGLILALDFKHGAGNVYDGIFFMIIAFSIMPFTYKPLRKKIEKGGLIVLQIGLPIFLFIFLIISSVILFPPKESAEKTNEQETITTNDSELNNNIEQEKQDIAKEDDKNEETNIVNNDNSINEKLKFTIKDGETEEYAQIDYFDGKPYTRYYIPNGDYKVKALSKRSGLYVESKEIIRNSDGFDEEAYTVKKVDLPNIGDTDTITITDDVCVSFIVNSNVEFEQI